MALIKVAVRADTKVLISLSHRSFVEFWARSVLSEHNSYNARSLQTCCHHKGLVNADLWGISRVEFRLLQGNACCSVINGSIQVLQLS